MKSKTIITRFAPSPTGFLHIGAIRTALFAYLYAKANNGKFLLRIEDTDQTRYVDGAVQDFQDQLQWLGIQWDDEPVFQSQRLSLYKKYAEELLEKNNAYYCFCTKERLDALREEQQKNKQNIGYDGHCRNLPLADAKTRLSQGETAVIRFKTPREGTTEFTDAIRGKVVFENHQLDDLILIKTDGYPTYHLAHVVDDHLMETTHVHRGEEWIPSTPKHILMFQALGWEPPQYVHLPVILSPGGGKLSKRKGAVFVREFKDKGYLKEAMINFMVLLGWGYDETREFFTLEELEKIFSHDQINKASPVFNQEKLDWFNGMYIRKKSVEELADLCHPYLVKTGLIEETLSAEKKHYYLEVLKLLHERLEFLTEIVDKGRFFFVDELDYPDRHLFIHKKSSQQEALQGLEGTIDALSTLQDFSIPTLEATLRELSEKLNIKTGLLFMPIRVAISGSTASPGLFEMMTLLGKEKVIARIKKAVSTIRG